MTRRKLLADFRSVDRNARNILLFEPLFGIPFNFCIAYGTLYRAALGLTPQQIGLLSSISAAAGMLCSLVAGFICDRMGRRKAGLVFGILGFAVPHLIFGLARSFAGFALGVVVGGMWMIEYTAWQCMVVDDTPQDARVNLFRWVNIFVMVSGLFTPIAGLFVGRYGLVPAARGFYLFAAACMTLMFVLRYRMTQETSVGTSRMCTTRAHSLHESLRDYSEAILALVRSRAALYFFLIQQAMAFYQQSAAVYIGLYMRDVIGIDASWVSVFPFVGAAVNLATFLLLIPRLAGLGERRNLVSGSWVYLAGVAVLVVCPRGWFALLVGSTVLTAFGWAILQPFLNAAWNNAIPDGSRAKVVSLTAILGSLICMPAGLVGGELFAADPRLPFLLGIALYVIVLVLLALAYRGAQAERSEASA